MDPILDDARAHTLAKHNILKQYLMGWLPILGQGQPNRLLYFDGFAGCGELVGQHPGSPVVAVRAAIQSSTKMKVPLEVRMVEENLERCAHLKGIIQRERAELGASGLAIQVDDPICGECEDVVTKLLDELDAQRQQLGPAFFFLDQYGYSGFSMDLIGRILSHKMCETFAYLNWQRMHPYLSDPEKAETFTRALGGEEWRQVQSLSGQARVDCFKSIYVHALRNRAGATYVYDFAMRDRNNQLIYWLFFCTNSLRGLKVMKKAMWKVDPTGRFEFSDQNVGQGMLLRYTESDLADDLERQLSGRALSLAELKEHVLVHTPEHRYGGAIAILKRRGTVKESRAPGKVLYSFSAPPAKEAELF